jgi:hypothetical protein
MWVCLVIHFPWLTFTVEMNRISSKITGVDENETKLEGHN